LNQNRSHQALTKEILLLKLGKDVLEDCAVKSNATAPLIIFIGEKII
jgi:hypothetical protein